MDFTELLGMLQNPGEDPYEGNIYDDLSASYTEATSTRDAKIEVTTQELEALKAELLIAKAANWDLLQSAGMDNSGNSGNDDGNESDSDDSDESDDIGDDDDFFEKKD